MPFGIKEELKEYTGKTVIEINNLIKTFEKPIHTGNFFKNLIFPKYERFNALNDVSFTVRKNEIFGLLGPNGAGKTTLIRSLSGIIVPSSGDVSINGKPVDESLQDIGVMFGFSMIYNRMSGYNNLKYCAKLYKVQNYKRRIKELADLLDLGPWMHTYVENYSLGMKCKLAIARALIHDPQILLLDEPTLGLDPKMSLLIREQIKDMNKTIILTTHYMQEANELCDRIGILNKGKLIRIGTPAKLKKLIAKNVVVNIGLPYFSSELINKLKALYYVHNISLSKTGIKVLLESKDFLPKLLSSLSGYKVSAISEEEPTLVDVFIRLTGESPQV